MALSHLVSDLAFIGQAVTFIGQAATFLPGSGLSHGALEPGFVCSVAIARSELTVERRVLSIPSRCSAIVRGAAEVTSCLARIRGVVADGSLFVAPRPGTIPVEACGVTVLR
ncbi:MAG TPA: hypothetical protein VFH54_06445 [Mycobacteriales bacterium]|nr:hypothetical protein [Mycobacteriales bacterium]